jgi:hypothetical protein
MCIMRSPDNYVPEGPVLLKDTISRNGVKRTQDSEFSFIAIGQFSSVYCKVRRLECIHHNLQHLTAQDTLKKTWWKIILILKKGVWRSVTCLFCLGIGGRGEFLNPRVPRTDGNLLTTWATVWTPGCNSLIIIKDMEVLRDRIENWFWALARL